MKLVQKGYAETVEGGKREFLLGLKELLRLLLMLLDVLDHLPELLKYFGVLVNLVPTNSLQVFN